MLDVKIRESLIMVKMLSKWDTLLRLRLKDSRRVAISFVDVT